MTQDLKAADLPASRTHRTLDLFAFPSDTRGWFRMLVVAACLVGLNVGFLTAQRLYDSADIDVRERLATFINETMKGRSLLKFSPREMEELGRRLIPVTSQLLRSRLPRVATAASFVLLFLGGAAAVYLDHPRRYRRAHRSRPLAAQDAPALVRDVQRWAANLGLPPPRLEHRQGRANDAQTFGLRGRETLLFHGDPLLLERVWSTTPKVVALHELGHLKNGDAQQREKSRAVWIALFGLLILTSCVLVGVSLLDLVATGRTAGTEAALAALAAQRRPLLQAAWRLAALLLLVAAIWTGLVRALELYADRRVASWGMESALLRLLELRDTRPLWHPSNRLRREVLADPGRLFRASPLLALVTGILLSALTVNLIFPVIEIVSYGTLAASTGLWQRLAPLFVSFPAPWGKRFLLGAVATLNLGRALIIFLLPLGVLSHLVAGTLGAQVQREAIADLAAGNRRTWGYARLWRPAALLALGVEVGFWVAPFNSGLEFSFGVRLLAAWLAGLTCLTWLWLAYVRALTRFTLGLHVGANVPQRRNRIVTGMPVALLTALYWPAGFARLAPQISIWNRVAQQSPQANPQEIFVYSIVMTGIVLAIAAVGIYLAGAGVSLAVVFTRLRRGRRQCVACGEPVAPGFAVGRCCVHCNEPLASWAYEVAAFDRERQPEEEPPS